MIELIEVTRLSESDNNEIPYISLPIDLRIKSRQRVTLSSGEQAGLFLTRGTLLRGGDVLLGKNGEKVQVIAAEEKVSTAWCADKLQLARAAYHLGNRHVPLQIEERFVRYQHDHVLDEMLQLMGVEVTVEMAPFEPEAGAYQQQGAHGHHH